MPKSNTANDNNNIIIMSLPIHLQYLLADPSVQLVIDNACTHGKRQRQRQPLLRTRSTPSVRSPKRRSTYRQSQSSNRGAPIQREVSRWESMPTQSVSKDVAPIIAQRMGGSATITIAASLRPPARPARDVAPVCRRPTRSAEDRMQTMTAIMDILDSSDSKLSLESTLDIFDEDLLSDSLNICSIHSTFTL